MRILYIHQHFTTPAGASGTRSYEMARRLISGGHDVTMICGSYIGGHTGVQTDFLGGKRSGVVDGIRIVEFDLSYTNSDSFLKRTRTFIRFALGASKLALTENADMLVATSTPLTVGIPGILFKWIRRKPFVFEVRDLWPELPKAMNVITNPVFLAAMSLLEWASYRSADRLVALAPGIAEGIARRGIPVDRIQTVPNGCDLELFSDKQANDVLLPGVLDSDFVALYAGTHGVANGLDAVLDAAKALQERSRNNIKFVLVGQGKMKAHLQARVVNEKLTNVIFLGPMPKVQLANLFNRADVGIQSLLNIPAFYNGTSPNKFFDYLASGLPVVNNYPGWVAEMITATQCGIVVPPQDAHAFANALEYAAENPEALQNMARNAVKLAKSEFSRDALADQWVSWVTTGQKSVREV